MTATQGYMAPGVYPPTNMFAQAGRNTSKSNDFFKVFGNTTTSNRTIEPQRTAKQGFRGNNIAPSSNDEASFFDFDSPTNPGSPYQQQFSTPGASGMPWAGDMNFRPLSPPNSASFTPKNWSFGFEHQNPSNILTNIEPSNTRAQYGQVTPPDDENDNESLLDYQLSEQHRQMQQPHLDPVPKKRRRNGFTNDQGSQPSKRTRKYASRGANAPENADKPEDVKRSKFLERNRVAASKCRQKKKEWTQNLETRARELQKNNSILRMEVDSCRQEILFLKGEILKHNSCECAEIQDFIKTGTNPFTDTQDDGMIFKREQSPIESMPRTPGSRRTSPDLEGTSPAPEPLNDSIVDDENALEALLSNSTNHDTSREGINP